MGSIEQRGKRYRAVVRWHGQKLSRTFATKTAARQWIAATETDLARGDYRDPDAGAVTFARWARIWTDGRQGLKPSTLAAERGIVNTHLNPALGHLRLDEVRPSRVQALVGDLAGRRAPKTIRNVHSVLHNIMELAVRDQLIPSNPCVGTRLPENRAREMACLTEQQLEHLIGCAPDYWRPLIVTLAGTGLRWGEAVGLKVDRVDLLAGRLSVVETLNEADGRFTWGTPKTPRSRRVIGLPAAVVDALVPLVAGKGSNELVFTGREGGPVRHRNFNSRVWHPVVKAAGLDVPPTPRIHDLRHTHAALLIAAGVPLTAIQHRLGHESIKVTSDVYGYLLPRVDEGVTAALDRAFGSAVPTTSPATEKNPA